MNVQLIVDLSRK